MMAVLGWLVLVVAALLLTALAFVVFFGSLAWSGKADGEAALPAALAVVLWGFAYKCAPFALVMAGGAL